MSNSRSRVRISLCALFFGKKKEDQLDRVGHAAPLVRRHVFEVGTQCWDHIAMSSRWDLLVGPRRHVLEVVHEPNDLWRFSFVVLWRFFCFRHYSSCQSSSLVTYDEARNFVIESACSVMKFVSVTTESSLMNTFLVVFCHLPFSQMAQEGMELWYQLGYLVCWLILWLRDICSSSFICYSQVLLSTYWSGAIVVPIWILSVHLHSSIGKVLTKLQIYLGTTILLVYNCATMAYC